jgi:hypothetical protein
MIVYLASPYSAQPHRDLADAMACEAAGALMLAGLVVFSPIAHGCAIQRQTPAIRETWRHGDWMAQCLPVLRLCDALVVLTAPGWRDSRGVAEEIQAAHDHGQPVIMLDPGFADQAAADRIRRVVAEHQERAA